MSTNDLATLLDNVRRRAAERRRKQPLSRLEDVVRPDSWRRERWLTALARTPFAIIAECKRRSTRGEALLLESEAMRSSMHTRQAAVGPRWFELAQAYASGGASALCVVTEEDRYEGSLDDLRAVEFTQLPRLRRDFILDTGMVIESCLWGVDALLLLPAIVDDARLAELRNVAKEYGLAVIVEVQDEAELARALVVEPDFLGASGRDLATGAADPTRLERLLRAMPDTAFKIATSGITGAETLDRARAAGARAAIVGEALIRSADPEQTLRSWVQRVTP